MIALLCFLHAVLVVCHRLLVWKGDAIHSLQHRGIYLRLLKPQSQTAYASCLTVDLLVLPGQVQLTCRGAFLVSPLQNARFRAFTVAVFR